MKLKWIIILLVAVFIIAAARYLASGENVGASFVAPTSTTSSSINNQLMANEPNSSLPASAASSSVNVSVSTSLLSASSKISLSGARVEALPEIVNFLNQLDNAIIPKIYLPDPKRDSSFDYRKGSVAAFKAKALDGDPYAAYIYAEHAVKNKVRSITDAGTYSYEQNFNKRVAGMDEAREFYIRAFKGGLKLAANDLSQLFANSRNEGDRIESLAWRKISFAVGEGERFDCLRNSTLCVVKDFNNLNRLEYFYPCLSSAGDSCTQSEYDTAMTLALQYADSLDFAISNKVIR